MATETLHCPDCEKDIESTEEIEKGTSVPEFDPETVTVGGRQRDLWLCTDCGKILGVN